jgi:hypothetical protein
MSTNPEGNASEYRRLESLCFRVAEIGQANMLLAGAEQGGRFEAAARANASNVLASEPAANDSGASPSNTPLSSSQVSLPGYPDYKATFGIDWLEWGGRARWSEAPFARLMDQLERAKLHCQETDQPEVRIRLNESEAVHLQRLGAKRGGARGEHYEYRFIYKGIPICLARRSGDVKGGPANFFVCLRGEECLMFGALESYAKVNSLLQRLGAASIDQEKISRVDLRLDVTGLNVQTFRRQIDDRCFITRFADVHGCENKVVDGWTGFTGGKSPLHLDVYDKKEERRRSFSADIQQALIDRCWGGTDPDHATRVEFQMRRNWLKKFGINSIADLLANLGSLVHRLTSNVFRLTVERVDSGSKHQSRATIDPLWLALAAAFEAGANSPIKELVPIRYERINPSRLISQGMGCLVSAALQRRLALGTFHDLRAAIIEFLRERYPDDWSRTQMLKKYWHRLKDKMNDLPHSA